MIEERLEDLGEVDVWSVSALKTIGTCGKQYEFRYRQVAARPEATPPLVFGSAVHKCIERLHKENDKWNPGDWMRMWNDEWYNYASTVNWEGFRKSQFDKLGGTMLANYVEKNEGVEVLEIEVKFPSKKGEAYNIGQFATKGIIDQVRRLPNGKLLVVDLKTSKEKPDPLLLRADPQFTLYWNVIRQRYGEEPLLAWLHLRTGDLIYTKRNEKDLDLVEEMLKEGQYRVNHEMFARNIGFHCKFCPFMKDCLGVLNE